MGIGHKLEYSSGWQRGCILDRHGRVGKTSLLVRYVHNQFNEAQPATCQASYLTKRLEVDGDVVTLALWDTAGQERFHALGPIYYRDADAALLVYDCSDRDSFARVKSWVNELRAMAGPSIMLALAGNKCDLDPRTHFVSDEEARSYAASIGGSFFATSAKTNVGIEATFLDLAKRALAERRRKAALASTAASGLGGARRSGVDPMGNAREDAKKQWSGQHEEMGSDMANESSCKSVHAIVRPEVKPSCRCQMMVGGS
eukprot:jgi/Mesvir1/24244/Mv10948-RA.1